ncbi:MAG: hypothetical protein IKO71_08340 [Bacteroidaceae bacterium]|nr:hypothetical protein [Bacteroidaceae bacterium]MBR6046771.1 hypothetical protein [Bacteroidaceae bacterium]
MQKRKHLLDKNESIRWTSFSFPTLLLFLLEKASRRHRNHNVLNRPNQHVVFRISTR